MNVVGLYLGNPTGWAFMFDGIVRGVGSQNFQGNDDTLAYHFGTWATQQDLSGYDAVAVWTPTSIHPRHVPLYRWGVETYPTTLRIVRPREVRELLGIETPTLRDYMRFVRRNHVTASVRSWEEALAVLACAAASDQARAIPEPSPVRDRREQRFMEGDSPLA